MRYPNSYLFSHDIDWFWLVNGVYVHVASAGGLIPDEINDIDELRRVQHQVEMLPDIYSDEDLQFNNEVIESLLNNNLAESREEYIKSFAAMARKGFVTFDRTNIGDLLDNQYHMVCKPKTINRTPQGIDLQRTTFEYHGNYAEVVLQTEVLVPIILYLSLKKQKSSQTPSPQYAEIGA